MKILDSILKKTGIPILRLKTNESNEKDRIITCLDKILFEQNKENLE